MYLVLLQIPRSAASLPLCDLFGNAANNRLSFSLIPEVFNPNSFAYSVGLFFFFRYTLVEKRESSLEKPLKVRHTQKRDHLGTRLRSTTRKKETTRGSESIYYQNLIHWSKRWLSCWLVYVCNWTGDLIRSLSLRNASYTARAPKYLNWNCFRLRLFYFIFVLHYFLS